MTDFKKPDRLRSAGAILKRSFRQVRSTCLKGMTVVQQKTQPAIKYALQRRKPIMIASASAVAVVGILIGTQQYVQAHTNSYYKVLLNGQPIGEISSKQLVEEAVQAKSAQLASADVTYQLNDNQVAYEEVSAFNKSPDDEATLQALNSGLKSHPVGVKLVVGGKTVAFFYKQQTAYEILQRIKDKFVPNAAAKTQVKALAFDTAQASEEPTRVVKSVSFEEDITIIPTDINPSELADPEDVFKKLTTGNPAKRTYTVQKGDCISCIAEKTGVPSDVIYANNPWIQDDEIKPGDELDITVKKPVVHVTSEEEVTEIEVIDPPVEIRKSEDMKVGQSKTLREGKDGKKQVTYRLVKNNGMMVEEEQIASQVLEPAVSTIILKGTKVIPSEGTGKFAWPVSNHRITSYMGTRWGKLHKGIDMVGDKTIKAADNGTVEFVGQKTGYGNVIIINHNNGFETLYGHLKSFSVKEGQVVSKGDKIGIMGNTGESTGTHLHFEVHLNGDLKNPTSYL
ncbi:M23 family metallopeptidase [Cohnella lubricantis]|uniref:M23 family metallopeptidase n=1 Tax=Cohnella lubricantis TaxID=2163172 RepID=A0A841TA79_9BACL|nr:M23 family metallopeptidase [Cohnella lubricantis]MBB6678204.1 M23 family metallopeptidase [Cohnella lubricantis]